jgi:hypothetical protein
LKVDVFGEEPEERRGEERRGPRLVFGLQMLEALFSLGVRTCQALLKCSLGVYRFKCTKRFNSLTAKSVLVGEKLVATYSIST